MTQKLGGPVFCPGRFYVQYFCMMPAAASTAGCANHWARPHHKIILLRRCRIAKSKTWHPSLQGSGSSPKNWAVKTSDTRQSRNLWALMLPAVLRIRSIFDRIRIRLFGPDPDPGWKCQFCWNVLFGSMTYLCLRFFGTGSLNWQVSSFFRLFSHNFIYYFLFYLSILFVKNQEYSSSVEGLFQLLRPDPDPNPDPVVFDRIRQKGPDPTGSGSATLDIRGQWSQLLLGRGIFLKGLKLLIFKFLSNSSVYPYIH